ncbi:MAG: hypothetical protein HKN47_04985 [Pirellulaceae bacterium]|nr:hypothetical protein [Pirellulaceae bacterium]
MTDSVNIAVFGDTHGHLRLMLQLCRLWQRHHDVHLDGVLQCGDFGYFPDITRIDRATKAHAKRDPEELGFAEYFAKDASAQDELVEQILNGPVDDINTVGCPIVFCHGNHEDFELLANESDGKSLAAVDRYDRFQYLRSGATTCVAGLTVAALGGGPEPIGEKSAAAIGQYVSHACGKSLGQSEFDILLSHGSPQGIGGESDRWGSGIIRDVIQSKRPEYCFFAHHREKVEPAAIGRTQCYWHNDVNFQCEHSRQPTGPVERHCMGVLTTRTKSDYQYVDDDWIASVTASTWRYL